jgi:hypothetical protein
MPHHYDQKKKKKPIKSHSEVIQSLIDEKGDFPESVQQTPAEQAQPQPTLMGMIRKLRKKKRRPTT